MLDIICSIFDMALIIIFFNATMKKRREAVPFWLFLFIFACIEGLLGFLAQFLSYAKQNHSFYIMAGISLLSLFTLSFLYEGKFVHRIFAAITFQLFATLAEVFTFLFIKLFPVETSEKLLGNPVVCSIVSKLFLFLFIMITNIVFLKRKKIFSFQYTLLICIMPLVSIIIMMTIPDQFEGIKSIFIVLYWLCWFAIYQCCKLLSVRQYFECEPSPKRKRAVESAACFSVNKIPADFYSIP